MWLQRMGFLQPPEHVLTIGSVPTGTGHVTPQELAQQSLEEHFTSSRSLGHGLSISFVCRLSGAAPWLLYTEHRSTHHYLVVGLLQT